MSGVGFFKIYEKNLFFNTQLNIFLIDFVAFLHNREMLTTEELQKTGEESFRGDALLYATEKNLGSEYCEIREYTGYSQMPKDYLKTDKETRPFWDGTILVRYAFITRAWRKDLHTRRILDNLTVGMRRRNCRGPSKGLFLMFEVTRRR